MYKKTVTYEDYEGVTRTEDFWFHLTKAELTMMDYSESGGLKKKFEKIMQSKDAPSIMSTFEDILHRSYGVKSPDGRRFMKSEELWEDFKQTEAYSIIFMELCTNMEEAGRFSRGIMPKDLVKELPEDPKALMEMSTNV